MHDRDVRETWNRLWPAGWADARRRGQAFLAANYGRASESARTQAVDVAMWEIAQKHDRIDDALALLIVRSRWRVHTELRRDGQILRPRGPVVVSLFDAAGTSVGDRVEAVDAVEDLEHELLHARCWVGVEEGVKAEIERRVQQPAVASRPDRRAKHQLIGSVAGAVAAACARRADARALWGDEPRLLVFRMLRALDPARWERYRADSLPTSSDVQRLGDRPAADWQALNGRLIGEVIGLLRDELATAAGRLGLVAAVDGRVGPADGISTRPAVTDGPPPIALQA